jgi:hypothetical protein
LFGGLFLAQRRKGARRESHKRAQKAQMNFTFELFVPFCGGITLW